MTDNTENKKMNQEETTENAAKEVSPLDEKALDGAYGGQIISRQTPRLKQ